MDYGYHVPGVMCAVPVPLQVGFYAIRYLKPESALGLHPHLRPGQSICVPFEIILTNRTIMSHSLGSQNDILTVSPIAE